MPISMLGSTNAFSNSTVLFPVYIFPVITGTIKSECPGCTLSVVVMEMKKGGIAA